MQEKATQQRAAAVTTAAVIVFVCSIFVAGCGGVEPVPEEQLRQWVRLGTQAVEAKERRQLVGMISAAYADSRGNDRDRIEALLRLYFLRQRRIKLITSIDEVRIYADSAAQIELTVGMVGINDSSLGFSADAYRFVLELELNDERWQLIAARWGEIGGDLH